MKKVLISAYVPQDAKGNPGELSSLRQQIGDLFHTVMEVSKDGSLRITDDHSGHHDLSISVSGDKGYHINGLKDLVARRRSFDLNTSKISLPAGWQINCERDDNGEALKLAFDGRTRLIYIVSVREDHEAMKALQAEGGQADNAFVSVAESLTKVLTPSTAQA